MRSTELCTTPTSRSGWSTYVEIDPYTTYDAAQVSACKGPGE